MLSKTTSASCLGIDAFPVDIEVDISNGLPQFTIVGLPDQAVRESKERVRAALVNTGHRIPAGRITVNLAPANLKKEGPAFDLGIALGLLASMGYLKRDRLNEYLFLGELALDGSLRPVKGALPVASLCRRKKLKLVVPSLNANEASLEEEVTVLRADSLKKVIDAVNEEDIFDKVPGEAVEWNGGLNPGISGDFSEVKGQFFAKRAAEIAAAGAHNLLLIGPPGAGKTMIAKRIPTVLPPLSKFEFLEIAKIHSASGLLENGVPKHLSRPFRSPHHTISSIGLVGGGSFPKPGEITLAHNGVLFLDEFPEFRRDSIEALRSPMEEGCILISRAKMNLVFPAQFLTVCAMNPCPCGFLLSPKKPCRCTMAQIQKYHQKISGPILDRLDLHVEIPAVEFKDIMTDSEAESSEEIRKRVAEARAIQHERFRRSAAKTNSLMTNREIKKYCALNDASQKLFERAMKELNLSARGYHKILKVARTIADLGASESLREEHLAEAIQYRTLDRNWFG